MTMLVLAVSALPVQALVFVYGGVTLQDIGDAVPVPRRCGNFNGQYRDLLFIGAAPLDGIDRLLLCDGGGVTAGTMAVNLFAYRMRSGRQIRMHLISMHRKWQVPAFYAISFFSIRLSRFIM